MNFEVEPGAKVQQPVMGAHARMDAARLKGDAQCVSYERAAGIEVRCHDDEVIKGGFHVFIHPWVGKYLSPSTKRRHRSQ